MKSVPHASPAPAAQRLPDGAGKATFERVCSLCHDPSAAVMGKQWTKSQWEAKVTEMLQEEPDVTTEEAASIVEYLAANFRPGGNIYVNRASVNDLGSALNLTLKESETLARHRDEKGAFKSVEDLRAIAGIDPAKIDAKKDLLVF